MQYLTSKQNVGFASNAIQRRSEPHAFRFLGERTTFWVAALSVIAFVTGNMVGRHGWYTFWASVLGEGDENLIVYSGTVVPVALVPDYARWYAYGGGSKEHTFRQVPQDLLQELPLYDPVRERQPSDASPADDLFSIGHAGSYRTGGELSGSHPGIDIRMPEGTPVLSIANGIVAQVQDGNGFGQAIVVKHPNVPDPAATDRTTTLYSVYAHLSAMYVSEGAIVSKGEQIGLSGSTGFATGPHLHFQIDRAEAPFHPYWPFTAEEAAGARLTMQQAVDAGFHQERILQYTIHPMLYVQANYPPVQTVADRAEQRRSGRSARAGAGEELAAALRPQAAGGLTRIEKMSRARGRLEERIRGRLIRKETTTADIAVPTAIIHKETVAAADGFAFDDGSEPSAIDIRHDGTFSGRQWETVRIAFLDGDGKVILEPVLTGSLPVRAAYGDAEFRPPILTAGDFVNGVSEVNVLPRGRRTVVIEVPPYKDLSKPMRYER